LPFNHIKGNISSLHSNAKYPDPDLGTDPDPDPGPGLESDP